MTIQGIWTKPLVNRLHERQLKRLTNAIPQLSNCGHNNFLALIKYLDTSPEKFYSKQAFRIFLDFLTEQQLLNSKRLSSLLSDRRHELDLALTNLDRLNKENWHDLLNPDEQYEFMQFCDSTLNTAYQKLTDGIYHHFIYVIAAILTLDKGKKTQGLDVFNCVEVIKKRFPHISEPYNNTIRNGIAHGSVIYRHFEIIYKDKHQNQYKLQPYELVELVDNLIDVCNGIALALKVFFLQKVRQFRIPQQIMLEELQAQTNIPWWKINGFLDSEIQGASQLIVFATPTTNDDFKVKYSAFYSAVLCEELAPGYDRYFFNLRSPIMLPGFAIFDGKKLMHIREKGPTQFEDYIGAATEFVFIPKAKTPFRKYHSKIETYYQSFLVNFPLPLEDFSSEIGYIRFSYRDTKIHRTNSHLFLESRIIIEPQINKDIQESVKRSVGRLLRKSLKTAKKSLNLFDRFFPLGSARLYIYQSDYRRRKLRGYGLGEDLVCVIQVRKLKEVKVPDILNSTIEVIGKYRIAWNKNWLDSN
jgi:hypothetical protein